MKIKLLLSILAFLFASQILAKEVKKCVAVSADGYKTTYTLVDIQRIEINAKGTDASMTILNKNGIYSAEYKKILFAELATEIEELEISSVFVFPNPVSNTLYIHGVEDDAILEVYTLTGKSVLNEKGTEIDVTSLNQGTYILRINTQHVKFIKK